MRVQGKFKGKVMVTGGIGFVGQHLHNYLKAKGYTVCAPSSSELDVRKSNDWAKYCNCGFDHLVHLAGKLFVPDSWIDPVNFFDVNMNGTLHAIDFCRKNKIGMTYISTYVYGQPDHLPLKETSSIRPNNPYSCSKHIGEILCCYYHELFDTDVTVLRLFNVYGPKQRDFFLIPTIIRQAMEEKDNISVADIMPARDYVYIDDVCSIIQISVEKTKGYHLFNVGSGESHSVLEIIEMVQNICGTKKKVISERNTRKNEITNVVADISSIKSEWNWSPSINMRDGLKRCVEGYHEQKHSDQ